MAATRVADMFDDALEAEVALGRARRLKSYTGTVNCTAWSVVRNFLTGFRTEQVSLCIWQRTLFSQGRRNAAREADGGLYSTIVGREAS